jgi:hypothetical protein
VREKQVWRGADPRWYTSTPSSLDGERLRGRQNQARGVNCATLAGCIAISEGRMVVVVQAHRSGRMDAWRDIGVPLLLAFVGGGVAALWPWLQVRSRGKRFQQIIKRELEEIGPNPEDPVQGKAWWEHVTKRFVHEEIFKHENISQNRDFLLTLDGTVVYQVTQLWTAFEKKDATQWIRCIDALSRNRRLSSEGLRDACEKWERIIPDVLNGAESAAVARPEPRL